MLIAEDDEKTAHIVRSYLVHEGYRVEIVGDGLSALRAAQREPPDLVLLDVMLPEVDGWTCAARCDEWATSQSSC